MEEQAGSREPPESLEPLTEGPSSHPFSIARVVALAWLAFFVPYSWSVHGGWNLLFICDVAVILTCVGIVRASPLLLSSQALGVLVVQSTWTLDLVVRLYGGEGVIPGPNWMLNPEISLLYRSVSLYHAVWPFLLMWCLIQVGYDRRALELAALTALVLVSAGRLAPSAMNVNCAHDVFGRSWQPPWLHVGIVVAGLTVFVLGPTHLLLRQLFREPPDAAKRRKSRLGGPALPGQGRACRNRNPEVDNLRARGDLSKGDRVSSRG